MSFFVGRCEHRNAVSICSPEIPVSDLIEFLTESIEGGLSVHYEPAPANFGCATCRAEAAEDAP